jgi:hypothetical protein
METEPEFNISESFQHPLPDLDPRPEYKAAGPSSDTTRNAEVPKALIKIERDHWSKMGHGAVSTALELDPKLADRDLPETLWELQLEKEVDNVYGAAIYLIYPVLLVIKRLFPDRSASNAEQTVNAKTQTNPMGPFEWIWSSI